MANHLSDIHKILVDILDLEEDRAITGETYLIRDLGAESIDLLEIAVALNNKLNLDIIDEAIFLRRLRDYIAEAEDRNIGPEKHLHRKFPFLDMNRIKEILADLERGPVLKVKDMIAYIEWKQKHDA